MVQMKIQFNGKVLTLPINPESITISRSAENEDIDIIGLGKATRKAPPGLKTLSIESFFPSESSYYYTNVKPVTCVNFIEDIWKAENKNNNVAKITTIGLPINLNMYFVINSFNYDHKAGEEDDIYYTLDIKEYKPYGVTIVPQKKTPPKKLRTQSTAKKVVKQNTYIVQSGDCLWNITKAATGDGSKWKKLYELNKKVIGKNPNLIYPGQKLTLPVGWSIKGKVTKLKNVSSGYSSYSKSTSTKTTKTVPKYTITKKPPKKIIGPVYTKPASNKQTLVSPSYRNQNTKFTISPITTKPKVKPNPNLATKYAVKNIPKPKSLYNLY